MESKAAPGTIRVLIVEDHPVVCKGLQLGFMKHPHIAVVGEIADGKDACMRACELSPQVVLMDIGLAGISGLEATKWLRKEAPEVRILVFSIHDSPEHVLQAIQAGAHGFISKRAPLEELVHAIEVVWRGEVYFSEEVAQMAVAQIACDVAVQLTPREREVLILIADGYANKEIANELGVGVRTAETCRERLMRRLNVKSVAGLTRYAVAHGLTTLEAGLPAAPPASFRPC